MIDNNSWHKVYNSRKANEEILASNDTSAILLELKRCNGWDTSNEQIKENIFAKEYSHMMKMLTLNNKIKIYSMYEIGCGSGANLFMFLNDEEIKHNKTVGGCDFSQALIQIAKKILHSNDITHSEANMVATQPQYDAVISTGVIQYFKDKNYLIEVLNIMLNKAKHTIAIQEILDQDKKEQYFQLKKSIIKNYEERYKDLKYLFLNKKFFNDFAVKHDLNIKFTNSAIDQYYHNKFVFNCYMYKN